MEQTQSHAGPAHPVFRTKTHLGEDYRKLNFVGETFIDHRFESCSFVGADLSDADLSGASFIECDFSDAILRRCKLDRCEFLGSILVACDLSESEGQKVGFAGAFLSRSRFLGAKLSYCSFAHAELNEADFSGAELRESRFCHADLRDAGFWKASLKGADLSQAKVAGAVFDDSDIRQTHLKGLVGYEEAQWYRADIRDVNFSGAYLIRRHIMDENYLLEFRSQSRVSQWLYTLWWATSDCGRSPFRWAAWTFMICIAFAGLYSQASINFGPQPTALSPLYFSVVTLTTLGFGDVLPVSGSAQLLVMVEVVLGYLSLGGLLGIFGNKMASRAN